MHYTEFLIQFSKALKTNNTVSILDLLTKYPFFANKSVQQDSLVRNKVVEVLDKNKFFNTMISKKDPFEATSITPHITRRVVGAREFNTHVFEDKMHSITDFTSTKEGFMQVKNRNIYKDKNFLVDWKNNRMSNHKIEIYTNNNDITYDYETLQDPEFKIIQYETLENITPEQINEMVEEYFANESQYLEFQKKELEPLWERHKTFIKKLPKIEYDISFDKDPQFNIKNPAEKEKAELLSELHKIHNISFKKK